MNEREGAGKERRLVDREIFVVYFRSNTYNRFTAVPFQFSIIGSDPGAARLLEELDQDPDIGGYIDMLLFDFDFEHQMEDKWFVGCRILLFVS